MLPKGAKPMTEAEWLACTDPDRILAHLLGRDIGIGNAFLAMLGLGGDPGRAGRQQPSARKLRLFAVACCGRIRTLMRDERSRNAVRTSARYADGLVGEEDLRAAQDAAGAAVVANDPLVFAEYLSVAGGAGVSTGKTWYWAARAAAAVASSEIPEVVTAVSHVERAAIEAIMKSGSADDWAQAIGAQVRVGLQRDIFGNPFRPARPPAPAVLAWNDGTVRRIAEGIYAERAFDRLPILADALLDAGCDDAELLDHCRSEGPHVRGCWALDLILGKN